MDLMELGKAIQELSGIPVVMVIIATFAWGWMLKNHSPLNNKLIPWFVVAFAIALTLIFFSITPMNVVIGFIIGYVVIAFYEHVKNTLEAWILHKRKE